MFRLIVPNPWRYRHPKRGMQIMPAGEYSVPEQVSHEVADRAVSQGVATKYRVRMPESVTMDRTVSQPTGPRGRRRKAKGPAPENMALGPAPENKAAVH